MKYQQFRDYVALLKSMETSINWRVISPAEAYIRSEAHERLAGLQFADIAARSFAEAVEPNIYGTYEPRYALTLKPVVYSSKGNYASYGAKVLANLPALDDGQRAFLSNYPPRN